MKETGSAIDNPSICMIKSFTEDCREFHFFSRALCISDLDGAPWEHLLEGNLGGSDLDCLVVEASAGAGSRWYWVFRVCRLDHFSRRGRERESNLQHRTRAPPRARHGELSAWRTTMARGDNDDKDNSACGACAEVQAPGWQYGCG
jgi:hypothetical protein